MSKSISFNYKGKEYTLEYTRKTVETMERQGFRSSAVAEQPATMLPHLFRGSFLANHPTTKNDMIEEIYSQLSDRTGLVNKLTEMYSDPILSLLDDPEEGLGNIEWGATGF